MKLLHVTTFRLSAITAFVLAFWSVSFYFTIVNEMNDELDDSLEDYAEMIIRRQLKGETLPTQSLGSNNQFFLKPISGAEAQQKKHIVHSDRQVYIDDKNEYEPARVITYIFQTEEGRYYELEVSTPAIDQADLKETIFWSILILYVTILFSIFLINLWTIRYTMRPLHHILQWLERYQLNKPNIPLHNPTNIDEFERLNQGVSEAMQRNEEVYARQRMFIGHASHELQTPLAISLNRIEMLLEDEQMNEQQMSELVKVRQTLGSMAKLNRSLLLLSRIENKQFTDRIAINITEKIHQLLSDFYSIYAHKGIDVSIQENAPCVVQANEMMVTTLLTNLLKNAFVHNNVNGNIIIDIYCDNIVIKNTGVADTLDASQIFVPFFHSSQNSSSTGLGLALAQTICEQNNWHLTYRFDSPYHCFCLHV